MKKATIRMVPTPHGEGRLHTRRATSPMATLLLSHNLDGPVGDQDPEEVFRELATMLFRAAE